MKQNEVQFTNKMHEQNSEGRGGEMTRLWLEMEKR